MHLGKRLEITARNKLLEDVVVVVVVVVVVFGSPGTGLVAFRPSNIHTQSLKEQVVALTILPQAGQ
jgi:hypothetical protein